MIYYNYLFKDDRNNYKIGISKNPTLRLGEIKFHNPTVRSVFQIGYVAEFMGDSNVKKLARDDEAMLHERFKNKRIFGEWFKLSNKDVVRIWKFFRIHLWPMDGKFINQEEALKIFEEENGFYPAYRPKEYYL